MEKPNLVHKYENVMFVLSIITTITVAIYLLVSIIGAIFFIFFGLLTLFSHAISMSHIQINGVRLKENQFPELYNKVVQLSKKMEIKKVPEVYIIESGGLLNAFATKVFALFGKNMVILYSDFVDVSLESGGNEIEYIIAHELAHLKRNHVVKTVLLFPAMWVPFVGVSYSRMAEFTCDRMAAYYTNKPVDAINGLLVLAAGRRLYNKVNLEEYLNQYNEKKGIFVTLTELLSTHPPIPKRIHEIENLMFGTLTVPLINRGKQTFAILFIIFFLFPVVVAGIFFAGFKVVEELGLFNEFPFESEYTPLMEASMNGEIETVSELLSTGADPNEMNEFGESSLLVAIVHDQVDVVPVLLENGADPNLQDDYGWTPLMSAVTMENIDIGKMLLEAGADPMLADFDDMSALDYAEDLGNKEFIELLNAYIQE
jgi:Zn-dependent protease with chaperone function